jgi:hypothetical protein
MFHWQRTAILWLLKGAGVFWLLAFLSSPVRADCTHASGSWSDFSSGFHTSAKPGETLQPLLLAALPLARPGLNDLPNQLPEKTVLPSPLAPGGTGPQKGPCVRCPGDHDGAPPPVKASSERLDLLDSRGESVVPSPWCLTRDAAKPLYQFDPISSIQHPPRAS